MSSLLPVLVIPCMGLKLALPLACVAEVFRPLPTAAVPGAPDFVLGLAQVRGQATAVLDLNRLLDAEQGVEARRYVRLRVDGRDVVLAVEDASELKSLDEDALQGLPPLLERGAPGFQALAALDERLWMVLNTARLLPKGGWDAAVEAGA